MRKKLLSAGFQSPNFTQVPNDFFPLIPEMDEAELRVTLIMIRETFGYHREGFRMGINKLAEATGLSRNGTKAGAEAAEERGTFRRVNPDAQGSAMWELVVDHPVIEGWSMSDQSASDQVGGQPVTPTWSASDQQSRVKESIKKVKENTTTTANTFSLYESNIGPLTPIIADTLKDLEVTYSTVWVLKAITEAAKSNVRKIKFIEAVLVGYKERGGPDIGRDKVRAGRTPAKSGSTKQDQSLANIQNWLEKQEAQNGN